MAGPWEKYGGAAEQSAQTQFESGPWGKYALPEVATLKQEVAPREEPQPVRARTTGEEFMRQLGLTGRLLATVPTNVGGAIADFGVGAANLLGAEIKERPSAAYQKLLTQLGLPEPETPLEKGVQIAGNIAGAPLDPGIAGAARLTNIGSNVVSSEAPQVNPFEAARLVGNLAMHRYGSAAVNAARVLPKLIPHVPPKNLMGMATQAQLESLFFDPQLFSEQQKYLQSGLEPR